MGSREWLEETKAGERSKLGETTQFGSWKLPNNLRIAASKQHSGVN